MIIVTKVDLHSLKTDRLNEMIDLGYKPVAWVPHSGKMVIFMEGEEEWKKGTVDEFLDDVSPAVEEDKFLPIVEVDNICKGITVAGNPCKGARFEGTEYCVAHQDQG